MLLQCVKHITQDEPSFRRLPSKAHAAAYKTCGMCEEFYNFSV